jgi:3-methyladenine DNA glycosylase AlkD
VDTQQVDALISTLCISLQAHDDRETAKGMEAYMKHRFSFFGVKSQARKEIASTWQKSIPKEINPAERKEIVQLLFQEEQREIHYIAIDWMNQWKKECIEPSDNALLHHLITTHSWWDSVDAIASNYLGKYIQHYPEQGADLIDEWRHSENMWLRRSCLIYQLKYGNTTNFTLLMDLINQFKSDKQFFIQKAIGWSLRQYSKYQPEAVRDFLQDNDLKGLARREAEKYL